MLAGSSGGLVNQDAINTLIAIVAVVWPILVTALDRAYGNGKADERLKHIEEDVREIRSLFVLTPREPSK
jgi:hypothetical protein